MIPVQRDGIRNVGQGPGPCLLRCHHSECDHSDDLDVWAHADGGLSRLSIRLLRLGDPAGSKQTLADQHVAGCAEGRVAERTDFVEELLCADEPIGWIARRAGR